MWDFQDLRDIALKQLLKLTDPITRILMFGEQKYELDANTWFVPAVKVFASRKEEVTEEQGSRLGMRHVLRICSARERQAARRYGAIEDVIREVYNLPSPPPQKERA